MTGDVLIARFVLALGVLLVLAYAGGAAARAIGQPRVIGEVVVGLLIGSAVLGSVAPALRDYVLPSEVAPLVNAVATIGLVVFMFLTGVEAAESRDVGGEPGTSRLLIVLSIANFGLPFVVGVGLAVALDGQLGAGTPEAAFVLFVGVALAVSALPVLARIVGERPQLGAFHGRLALAAAANGDIAAWSLLGIATGLAHQGAGLSIEPLAAAAIGVVAISYGLTSNGRREDRFALPFTKPARVVLLFAAILVATYLTQEAGIGLIFGSFLLGIVVAKALPTTLRDMPELRIVATLLLPIYFVETGARADLRLLVDPALVPIGVLLIAAAVGSKIAASLIASKLSGLRTIDGLTFGLLLNTRGLTELVVLNVGVSAGIISEQLFTLFVVMALVTTGATVPMLDLLDSMAERLRREAAVTARGPDEGM